MGGLGQWLTTFSARMEATFLGTPVRGDESVLRGTAIVHPAMYPFARMVVMHPLDEVEFRAGRDIDARLDGAMEYLVRRACERLDELERLVHELDVNWYAHHSRYQDRDNIDSTDGRTSVLLVHTNPTQTPEAYSEELLAWPGKRKAARRDRESGDSDA